MDYREQIIKHFTKLQKYIRKAAKKDSFPTTRHLSAIFTEIENGKKLVKSAPMYNTKSVNKDAVVLDSLFRIRIGSVIFVNMHPVAIHTWAKRNGMSVEVLTCNITPVQPNRNVPNTILMVKLLKRNLGENEGDVCIGRGLNQSGEREDRQAIQTSTA